MKQICPLHVTQEAKGDEERGWVQYIFQEHVPNSLISSHKAQPPKDSIHLPTAAGYNQSFNMWSLGDIEDPHYSSPLLGSLNSLPCLDVTCI